jgi:hypothetical protein
MAHVLIENRNGLVVDATTTTATRTAEREAAIAAVAARMHRQMLPIVTCMGDGGRPT